MRRFYNERRVACAKVKPNAGHQALAELQRRWGAHRVGLITQNIDGLLTQAQAPRVIEMHGSLWQLRCENDPDHPRFEVAGNQDPGARCRACEGLLRPDVVWFGEMPYAMDRIEEQMGRCTTFISVGTSGVVYPAAGLGTAAWRAGALCLEVNPKPCGGAFHHVFPEDSASLLPRLVRSWLDD